MALHSSPGSCSPPAARGPVFARGCGLRFGRERGADLGEWSDPSSTIEQTTRRKTLDDAFPMASRISSRREEMASAFPMAESGGGDLWTAEDRISHRSDLGPGISECEVLSIYVSMCHDCPCGSLCGIGARAAHVKNLGGVPMKTYF